MIVRCRRLWCEFSSCRRGVAAIEFGLLAPLFLLMLALSIEMGRAYQAYRMFENAVTGVARELASFPEYDLRARTVTPLVAAALLPPDSAGKFHLSVTSLTKDAGAMKQVFTHALFGVAPKVAMSSAAASTDFQQGESVIYISAAYDYSPLFNLLSSSAFRLTKTYTVYPYFARNYVWNDGNTANVYVN